MYILYIVVTYNILYYMCSERERRISQPADSFSRRICNFEILSQPIYVYISLDPPTHLDAVYILNRIRYIIIINNICYVYGASVIFGRWRICIYTFPAINHAVVNENIMDHSVRTNNTFWCSCHHRISILATKQYSTIPRIGP